MAVLGSYKHCSRTFHKHCSRTCKTAILSHANITSIANIARTWCKHYEHMFTRTCVHEHAKLSMLYETVDKKQLPATICSPRTCANTCSPNRCSPNMRTRERMFIVQLSIIHNNIIIIIYIYIYIYMSWPRVLQGTPGYSRVVNPPSAPRGKIPPYI